MKDAIGAPVPRKEDLRLITGRGTYVSDLQPRRTQHVAFLRSPHAHARIGAVDVSAARELAGVRAVFTGEDFREVTLRARSALPGYVETVQPVLAAGKVRFAGEAVAAVVADSRYLAEDALALIDVDYVPLPVTVTAWDTGPGMPVHDEAPDNVLLTRTFTAGDAEAALTAADLIVERELITNRHAGNPMECRVGLALWQPERRRLTFWSSTQVPHIIRNIVAELLGLPESGVRVIAPDVGGGFGVKAGLYPEDVALCRMARALPDTPVKWVEDRGEHLLAACHARDHRYLMKAGFSRDGGLLALRADITCNTGAYSGYPWTAGIEPLMAGGLLSGPYRLANYDCTVRGVATNTAPAGPYRGVDEQAHRAEQQRRTAAGEPRLGVGFACYNELTGLGRAASAGPRMPFRTGHDACTVRINPDGTVTAFSGVTSQGQGLETTIAQVVADTVGVGYNDVEVRIGDTDESLWGFGAFSSRQAVIGGGAARLAGEAVRDRALRLAAGILDAKADELTLSGGQPTSAEIPELVIGHVSHPAANPLGVRGVGEGGTLGPAAALAGAVGDALGVAVDRLPITPSALWELMTS